MKVEVKPYSWTIKETTRKRRGRRRDCGGDNKLKMPLHENGLMSSCTISNESMTIEILFKKTWSSLG